MYRDILVHLEGSESERNWAKFVVRVAVAHAARVVGLHVLPPPEVPPLFKPSMVESAVEYVASRLGEQSNSAQLLFEQEVSPYLAETSWIIERGDPVAGISAHARYADLVVLGQSDRANPFSAFGLPLSHSVIRKCGRPVLVVPDSARLSEPRRVAIAWDGSGECVRAVHDAIPFLRHADTIHLLHAGEPTQWESQADSASRLAEHLQRHGVRAPIAAFLVRGMEGKDALLKQVAGLQYDLLLMGAYSYPAWANDLFSGFTSSALGDTRVPTLFSH